MVNMSHDNNNGWTGDYFCCGSFCHMILVRKSKSQKLEAL